MTEVIQKAHSSVAVFDHAEEFARLKNEVLEKRRPMLVFGEEGSGKTRLLKRLASATKSALYVQKCDTPTNLVAGSLEAMRCAGVSKDRLKTSGRSLRSLTNALQRNLDDGDWILVLDNLQSPSLALGHLAKELNYYNRTPIAFAGRSEHMEDIGTFRTFCTDRSSRLELKPWSSALALEFTKQNAHALGLQAANLDEAVRGIAEMSKGYPGPILKMLQMATLPAYRRDGQIKFHVVWLDYRLRGTQHASGNMKPNSQERKDRA